MPILWRYLLKGYFQFFMLCVSTFVAVLLVIRFQEIAVFASSGASLSHVGLFSLYQIPYILPIAIPISCLIAAMILFQKMSTSLEITALRASGICLRSVCTPLLLISFVLSLINFSLVSEITPITRTKAKNLIYEIVGENPLIILQKDSMLDIKTADFDLKKLKLGKRAEEVICIIKQASSDRIGLFTAKEISVSDESLHGKSLSIISTAEGPIPGHDHLILENQQTMQMSKKEVQGHLLKKDWFAKDDLLKLKNILEKCRTEGLYSKSSLELIRRICLGLCPFTFTLIGIAFGTQIGRNRSKKGILFALTLSASILLCFVVSKTIQKSIPIALCLYMIPQPIAALLSIRALTLSSKGVE